MTPVLPLTSCFDGWGRGVEQQDAADDVVVVRRLRELQLAQRLLAAVRVGFPQKYISTVYIIVQYSAAQRRTKHYSLYNSTVQYSSVQYSKV